MLKYALFDLDGTLTDPYEGISKCLEYALQRMGFKLHDDYKKFIGPPLTYSFENFCGMSRDQSLQAVKVYRERFSTIGLFENYLYDGIPEVLQFLRLHKVTLAVATSKPTCFSQRILNKFNLSQYFDVIVGSELNGERIEKSEVIKECLTRLNVSQNDLKFTYMAGDRKFDMSGAVKNGITGIGIGYGYAQGDELKESGATYIVPDVKSLLSLFEKLIEN